METATADVLTSELDAPEEVGSDVVLLARQPILDTANRIRGHELIFRREDGADWPVTDDYAATAHVLVTAFADLALGALTSGSRAWIKTSAEFLLDTDLSVLPRDRVVLEVSALDHNDAALYARVVELARAGYTIALNQFFWVGDAVRLLEAVTYVKLDIRELGLPSVSAYVERLKDHDVEIVCERVDTAAEVDALVAMGIGLFQGYYFERPRLVRGRPAPRAELARLRQATSLTGSATFEDVEEVVKLDASVSVRLLRYINSAAVPTRTTVSSLRQAMMLLGSNTVRQWLLLVLMGELGDARPAALSVGLVRARLCEALAPDMNVQSRDSAFLVGLLSVSDALLDLPMNELVESLPLADDLKDALVYRQGPLGDLLDAVVALERGQGGGADARRAYALYSAVKWANEQLDGLYSAASADAA